MLASCSVEAAQISELYDADPSRIRIVAPGVDHAFFGPGDRRQARRALDLPERGPLLLFVGRIQPLKGVAVAVRALAALGPATPTPTWSSWAVRADPTARTSWTGSPHWWTSSTSGDRVRLRPARDRTSCSRPTTGPPTSASCPAGPSRSAWWPSRPPPAAPRWWPPMSAVCAASSTTAAPATWSRIRHREAFAAWVRQILAEPLLAERLSTGAVLRARRYTWARAAHLLREVYAELTAGRLVECS